MSQDHFRSSERTWERLSQVAVHGAKYDSHERQPHPKCLDRTRVDLLNYIHTLLDDREKSQLIWLHGTAGVGKSPVAFTVAEKMKSLKVTEETTVEKRLAGTFFFSRKHTKRCTTGYFFATLIYQLASNFPSVRSDMNNAIRENPALLDPNNSLCDQMEAFFLRPLRKLKSRLSNCPPLTFVIDALDECTSEPELADLILLLARALRDTKIPVTHILLTSRTESHIRKAFEKDEVRPLVCEIPVQMSGEGVATIISLDGADVDNDIYIFLQHSFRELASRHPDFPQPSRDELERLASRAGRRFIVASTMMKFIDDGDNYPHGRLQLMLELTSKLLPGTEVYKLYDSILSTCADPKRAYLHLSVVIALADPLPMSQISKILGPGLGRDVETALMQLRSVMDIPTDDSLPVNIYHSSIRDYVSDAANCSLPQVHDMPSPHSLLAESSLHLMMKEIPESTALLDALSELQRQRQWHVMQSQDPQRLKGSLAFLVHPPQPLSVLIGMLWLRGDRSSDLRSWLETLDGRAWLQTQGGENWLQTQGGKDWLQTRGGQDWLRTRGAQDWLQGQGGLHWMQGKGGQDWLKTKGGLQTEGGQDWLKTQRGKDWLESHTGRDWMQTKQGQGWLQTKQGQDWLESEAGQDWLKTKGGQDWLKTKGGQDWLSTKGGKDWLKTKGGKDWLKTERGKYWLETQRGKDWLESEARRDWWFTEARRDWLETQFRKRPCQVMIQAGQDLPQTQGGQDLLQTLGTEDSMQTLGVEPWLRALAGRDWLQTKAGRDWLQTQEAEDWTKTEAGRGWLQTQAGSDWLQTQGGQDWLQTWVGQMWLQTQDGRDQWLQTQIGINWLLTQRGRNWLPTPGGRDWLQTQRGQDWLHDQGGRGWLQTLPGQSWLQTEGGQDWLNTPEGRYWLKMPEGRAWKFTPVASAWARMEEFSGTLEAISRYTIIVPELPAFQAVQQFMSLPDFLMLPTFLALRHPNPSTSALPDGEIIRAMNAFTTFANEAHARSRSASGALNYACQHWAVHLSHATTPWDEMLNHVFQAFWDRHLLSWLERQWCLKGLPSCLVILSEGQKLAKGHSHHTHSAINAESRQSTLETSTPAFTSEMLTRRPSTPANPLLTEAFPIAPHASPVSHPRPINPTPQCSPATEPLAPPLPSVPSPRPNAAVFHDGTSTRWMSFRSIATAARLIWMLLLIQTLLSYI